MARLCSICASREVVIVLDREDIDAGQLEFVLAFFTLLLESKELMKSMGGRLDLVFEGYQNPWSLHEIPAVQRYIVKLTSHFPHWFYMMRTDTPALGIVLRSLAQASAGATFGGLSYEVLAGQFLLLDEALLDLWNDLGEPIEKYVWRIEHEVGGYFEPMMALAKRMHKSPPPRTHGA